MEKQIRHTDPPKEVDYKLLKKFGAGLYVFSLYLAEIIVFFHELRSEKIEGKSFIEFKREKIQKLKRLKNNIMDELLRLEETESEYLLKEPQVIDILESREKITVEDFWDLLEQAQEEPNSEVRLINSIKEDYHLEPLFKEIDNEINKTKRLLELHPLKGSPLKLRNIILSVWALAIKNAEIEVNWEILGNLLRWFYYNLSEATYGEKLKEKEDKIIESLDEKGKYIKELEMGESLDIELIKKHFQKYIKYYKKPFNMRGFYPASTVAVPLPYHSPTIFYGGIMITESHPFITGKITLNRDINFSIEFDKDMILLRRPSSRKKSKKNMPLLSFPNVSVLTLKDHLDNTSEIEAT